MIVVTNIRASGCTAAGAAVVHCIAGAGSRAGTWGRSGTRDQGRGRAGTGRTRASSWGQVLGSWVTVRLGLQLMVIS